MKTKRRAGIVLTALALFLALVITNIVKIAVFNSDYYKSRAFEQITTTSPLSAKRGTIYDSNMNILAMTNTEWRVFLCPKEVRNRSKSSGEDVAKIIANGLSEVLDLKEDELYKKITSSRVLDLTIKKSVNEDEYNKTLKFALENNLDDIIMTEANNTRYYPGGTMAAHVLGFTGSDNQGLYGLEYSYDNVLKGRDGYYLYAKDAGGLPMPNGYSTTVPAIDGASIVTTIDSYIQDRLECIIEEIEVNHMVSNRVCGIVMDTSDGAVLAMATTGAFDLNSPYQLSELFENKLNEKGYQEESPEYKKEKTELMQIMWSNKCVSETYEPGSTFKIITVAAALDSGSAKMSDTFSCCGYHSVGGWRIKCHKTTGHGSNFPLSYGLQMSCNPTMMAISERMGAETFYNYLEKFGYLEKSGIDLPSEARTIFHKEEAIGPTELATASFGQRFKVSIINHISAIAAVANGGYEVTPHIVDKIISGDGVITTPHDNQIGKQVISADVAKELAEVLEEGVSGDGGAKNAYVDGYKVAAKTGTSQKFDVLDENGNSYLRIGSTVAFAPHEGSNIAVIIVVDEPNSTVKYGSTVAAPYVSKLLEDILPYLEYEREGVDNSFLTEDYVGMNVLDCKNRLKGEIDYIVIGDGDTVISQLPSANVLCTKGVSRVYLYTEKRDEVGLVIPDVVGMSLLEANKILSNLGMNILLGGVKDLKSASLTIVSQSIPPGTSAHVGDVITIYAYKTDFED